MAAAGRKVTEILAELRGKKDETHYSFEYFLPRAKDGPTGHAALVTLASEMASRHHPTYLDLTWRGDITALDDHIKLATQIQLSSGLPIMLHIAIAQLSRDDCAKVLAACKAAGIVNIMALRGDPIARSGTFAFQPHDNGFSCARDFVKFIRDTTGDFFCIAVAGYPGGHRSSEYDMKMELDYTKRKVDAGADLVVTQGCFDADEYHSYITGLYALGCQVPVVPGILMFKAKGAFVNMARLCDIKVPTSWTKALDEAKDAKEALVVGQKLVADLVQTLHDKYHYHGFHLYTMNDAAPVIELFNKLTFTSSSHAATTTAAPSSLATTTQTAAPSSTTVSATTVAAPVSAA